MTITAITESREPCAEAGWFAYDWYLEEPVSRDFILALRPLGSLLLLESLIQPFFKVENHYYIIKGVLNDDHIRVAVHREHNDLQEKIKRHIGALYLNT